MVFKTLSVIKLDTERAIYRRARGVVAQVVGVHGAIYVVEQVVHAQLQSVCQHLSGFAQVVGGVDAPDLEMFPVAVVLVIARAAAACR